MIGFGSAEPAFPMVEFMCSQALSFRPADCRFAAFRGAVGGKASWMREFCRRALTLMAFGIGLGIESFPVRAQAASEGHFSNPPPSRAEMLSEVARFRGGLAELRAEAVALGVDAGLVDRVLADVSLQGRAIELEGFQPEFVRPVWKYLSSAASTVRIVGGRAMATRHAGLLAALEAEYGVPAEILLAIWGVETAYGSNLGEFNIFASLASLAVFGRRKDFARDQLLAALRVLGEIDPDGSELRGSWAGAMGHTQFIPTTFLAHAVDRDGDGRRDVWSDNPADALASAANYLRVSGWREEEPVLLEVRLPAAFDYREAELDNVHPLSEWIARGLTGIAGQALTDALPATGSASVILPAGAAGPAFLVLPNFLVLLAYNNATSYALAVWQLAERIAGRSPIRTGWPEWEAGVRVEEIRKLQAELTRLGHDVHGIDGRVGPATRAAVRRFQLSVGMTPDGYVNRALIDAVRAKAAESPPW